MTRTNQRGRESPKLWHLWVWISGCAVYFSLARRFLPVAPDTPGQFLLLSLLAVYTGLCWTGTMVALLRSWQGTPVDVEPGNWLLFSLGCILAVDLCVEFLPRDFAVRPESIQLGGTCLALALPTLSRRLPGRWKAFFALLVLLFAAKLVWLLASMSLPISVPDRVIDRYGLGRSVVGLALTAVLIVRDRQAGYRGGWLHWTGIACFVIWMLLIMPRG